MKPVLSEVVVRQLEWRYATQIFDASKKIPAEDWNALENALRLSPSSYGLQPWKFYVIEDRELRTKLRAASWDQPQIEEASKLVVFAVRKNFGEEDIERYIKRISEVRSIPVESLAGFRNGMLRSLVPPPPGFDINEWASRQVYISLGMFLSAAAMLGVDTCAIEGFDAKKYDDILKLSSQGYGALVVAAAGYRAADDKYAQLKKVRFAEAQIISRI